VERREGVGENKKEREGREAKEGWEKIA